MSASGRSSAVLSSTAPPWVSVWTEEDKSSPPDRVIYPVIEVPAAVKVDRKQALETAIRSIKDFHQLKYRLLAENVIIYPDRKANPPRYYQVYAFNFFLPRRPCTRLPRERGGVFL